MGHISHITEYGQYDFPLPWLWPQRLSIESHIAMWVELCKPCFTHLGYSIRTSRWASHDPEYTLPMRFYAPYAWSVVL
jgi:hypothetical protein